MHELAICQALITQVEALAEARKASAVTDIHVGIGPLSGVEADLLKDAFPIAAAGTVAAAASLHLRRTSVRVRCEECGAETDAKANRLLCGQCEHWRTTLIHGDELLLESVELKTSSKSTSSGKTANV